MKKKKIAPKGLQPIEGLELSEIEGFQELPDNDSWAILCGDLQEIPESGFGVFSEKS